MQRVVQRELRRQDGVVIGVDQAKALGDRLQPSRLGHPVQVGRHIGPVHDLGIRASAESRASSPYSSMIVSKLHFPSR